MFAITYPQLMNQALEAGFGGNDLISLREAYEFAERLFDGFYRGQGEVFISHLVRTASIVLSEKKDIDLVVAALVHAAYELGQFEDGVEGKATEAHRLMVRNGVGVLAEELIYTYQELPWASIDGIGAHRRNIQNYDNKLISVLTMRLANELENFLDLGMVYRGRYPYQEYIKNYGTALLEMAHLIGLPEIARRLPLAFEEHLNISVPATLVRSYRNCYEHPERVWQKQRTREKVKAVLKQKMKSLWSRKSASNDKRKTKLSFYSKKIFHQLDLSEDREVMDAIEVCLDSIKKLNAEIINSKFKSDPEALHKVSEEMLNQVLKNGTNIHSINSHNISNCIVFNAAKFNGSVFNDEILERRKTVDRVVSKKIDELFSDENDLSILPSGHFLYPPGGFMSWHTNSEAPGWRLYINYAEEPGKSFFRYRDPETGEVVTCWDKKWNFRLFQINKKKLFWHTVYSDTNRYSFGFKITLPKNSALSKRIVRKMKSLAGV